MLADREKQCIKNKRRYVKLMSLRIEQQQLEAKNRQEIFEKQREKEQAKERVSNVVVSKRFCYHLYIGTTS